jgi:hypothetical protein
MKDVGANSSLAANAMVFSVANKNAMSQILQSQIQWATNSDIGEASASWTTNNNEGNLDANTGTIRRVRISGGASDAARARAYGP